MIAAQIPVNEKDRLSELYRYEILDTPQEEEFDKMALLAAQICKTPISTISFIDRSRQWTKAVVGLNKFSNGTNTHRELSFCSHAILGDEFFEVKNALKDKRFADNPFVRQKPKIRFYAAMPLITSKGFKLGALCVSDTIPRKLSDDQIFALKVLSKQTVQLIELRALNREIRHTAEMQQRVISVMSHDIRAPLYSIKAFLDYGAEETFSKEEQEEMFSTLSTNVSRTLLLLDNLVEWGKIQLQFKEKTQVFKLKELVQQCIDQAELNVILKQNEIINLVEPDVLINADKEATEFILRNLMSNANKFTENGTIKISFFTKADKCYLSINDTGVGIETEKVSQIMQDTGLFHTNGTRNEKGSGLGLSLIKNYLHKTGNEIEIKSILNEGTSVNFSLCTTDQLVPILA